MSLKDIFNHPHDPDMRTLRPSGLLASEREVVEFCQRVARDYPVVVMHTPRDDPHGYIHPADVLLELFVDPVSPKTTEQFLKVVHGKPRTPAVDSKYFVSDSWADLDLRDDLKDADPS